MVGEFAALPTKDTAAAAGPEDCGENVTANGTDCPTAMVVGSERPLTVNSVLVRVIEEIVTGDPVALKVPLMDSLDPVVTLLKLSVVGITANCPGAVSLPDSGRFSCEFDASEVITRFPEAGPEATGTNTTLKVRL